MRKLLYMLAALIVLIGVNKFDEEPRPDGYATTYGSTFLLGPYAIGTGAIGAVLGGIGGALTC